MSSHGTKQHYFKKSLGQNFLRDPQVIAQMIEQLAICSDQHFVEIGPGDGALTRSLLTRVSHLDVVEFDRDLIPKLSALPTASCIFKVHQGDALAFDFSVIQTQQALRLVGNLPYNISTPLLFHFIQQKKFFQDLHLLLQKEVALRLAAKPADKNYGRLSVMVQYHMQVQLLLEILPHSFYPAPKVDSMWLRLSPYVKPPYLADNETLLAEIVKTAFLQRRKTVRNSLKKFYSEENFKLAKIADSDRAENISLEQYVFLCNLISAAK